MRARTATPIVCALVTTGAAVSLSGQADWPTYNHDEGSTRFSTLKEINTTNVQRLTPAWTYHMQPPPSPAANRFSGWKSGRCRRATCLERRPGRRNRFR